MTAENSRIKLLERSPSRRRPRLFTMRCSPSVAWFLICSRSLPTILDIAKGVAGFLKPLLSDGALTGSYKELVAVRISILCESEYAIRAHSASARKKGASGDQINAVRNFENGPFTEKEKLGFRLADRLHLGGA